MGRKPLASLLFLASINVGASSKEDTSAYTDALRKRLTFILKDEKLDTTQMSVEVFSMTQQESLYRLNPEKPLSPASAIKVLTAVVALERLGSDYRFSTEVFTDGKLSQGTLKGNLYLVGGGDPLLSPASLTNLVEQLQRLEIRQVTGQIVVDDWAFDQDRIDLARIPTDTDKAYNAPVGALSLNFNAVRAYFRPGIKTGAATRVSLWPESSFVKLANRAVTTSKGQPMRLNAARLKGTGTDVIEVTGSMPINAGEISRDFNITQPPKFAGAVFKRLLIDSGIKVAGSEIVHSERPKSARRIARHQSQPLREVVTAMCKDSNNFIADTLVKTIGREVKGGQGTMAKGLAVIKDGATRMGVNTRGFKVVSGSGLTRDNRMSAEQFVSLLNFTYLEFDILPELLSSLPIAGKDGTLKNRMKGTVAVGRLRAKTGTIDGVSSLVGLVQSRGGELIAFAILMNDNRQMSGSLRPWQNYFAQALAEFNRKASPMPEQPLPLPEDAAPLFEKKEERPTVDEDFSKDAT